MPELPEIRAHAERLTAEFGGAELARFEPISFTALKTYAPPPDLAYGHPLLRVDQRGKYLAMVFEPVTFVVHLMQGGRLRPDDKQSRKPRGDSPAGSSPTAVPSCSARPGPRSGPACGSSRS